jgi:hypothetical protein
MFTAIVLVCRLATTPASACNESSAVDLMSTVVKSELACSRGWQEAISRGALKERVGKDYYLKTLCIRNAKAPGAGSR